MTVTAQAPQTIVLVRSAGTSDDRVTRPATQGAEPSVGVATTAPSAAAPQAGALGWLRVVSSAPAVGWVADAGEARLVPSGPDDAGVETDPAAGRGAAVSRETPAPGALLVDDEAATDLVPRETHAAASAKVPHASGPSEAPSIAAADERHAAGPNPHQGLALGARTAADLATGHAGDDLSTPLAQSVEHALLVREGRRMGPRLPRPQRTRMMVIANQKGGVGKTTSTVNLAAALAQGGLRVLVVDLDPQGNASTALSIDHHRGTPSVYDVVVDGVPLADVVQPSPEIDGLFIAPSTIDLAGAEIELVSMVAREGRLRRALHAHPLVFGTGDDRFDYVLVDCPPSLGLLTLNALVAGDEMLIPIQAEYYALEGLGQLLETVEMVKAHLNPDLVVSTIVITMYDARTRLSAGVADEVRAHFAGQVLRTAIPRSVRISEAPSYGQTVMTYDPGSPGALSYLEAAREIAFTGAPATEQQSTTGVPA